LEAGEAGRWEMLIPRTEVSAEKATLGGGWMLSKVSAAQTAQQGPHVGLIPSHWG
jgi:hypothetical protein